MKLIRSKVYLAFVLFAITWMGLSTPIAKAHPHAWIDMRTTVKLDDAGRMTALEVTWLFGPFYSAFILEGLMERGVDQRAALNAIATENLKNLREFNYFSEVRAAGQLQDLGDAQLLGVDLKDTRYWMHFEIPLAQPVDPIMQQIEYAVFDPTYYIEILHAEEGERVGFSGSTAAQCNAQLIQPQPSEEILGFAASLDQTESSGSSLGQHFAETVRVSCR